MRLPLGRRAVLALVAALVAPNAAYVPAVPAPAPCSIRTLYWTCMPTSQPSRTSGAHMWLPMWRAAPIEVAKPSQERRRRPVMTWLWVGVRQAASLPETHIHA